MPLTPLFFRFSAVNAAFFRFQRRYRRYFPGSTPLMPLVFQFNSVNAAIFWFDAGNAAIFPVKRR